VIDIGKFCILLPVYNNEKSVGTVLNELCEQYQNIIVIDDGSTDKTADIIKIYRDKVTIITHQQNRGKGAALKTGFFAALTAGYTHAVTIDADGQHAVDEISLFFNAAQKSPDAIIIGNRDMEDESVPGKSSFGRKFSNFWFWVDTGHKHPDTQSGFRLYPLEKIKDIHLFSTKYELEIEVIVRASWRGIPVIAIPISVHYEPKETRISHFRPMGDNTRISILNTILFIIAFAWIKPRDFFLSFKEKGFKQVIHEQTNLETHTPLHLSLSIALGVFFAISPFWGWQGVLATSVAYLFRLSPLLSFTFSNISIPPFIPFIVYAGYKVGHAVTNSQITLETISVITVTQDFLTFVVGSLILAFGIATVAFLIAFPLLVAKKKRKME